MDDRTPDAAARRRAWERWAADEIARGFATRPRLQRPAKPPSGEARIAALESGYKLLSGTVSQLAGIVNRVAQQHTEPPPATAGAGAAATHDELVGWVCWLVDRYELTGIIPDCWAQHGRLVDELDALRARYLATSGNSAARLAWHHDLNRLLGDIEARGYCTSGHRDPYGEPWTGRHQPTGERIDLSAARYQPPASAVPGDTDEPEPPAATSPEAG